MAQAHIWTEGDGARAAYFWDDAEDHGGFDRNSPTGPFGSYDETLHDAQSVFGSDVEIIDGKPPRNGDEDPLAPFRP